MDWLLAGVIGAIRVIGSLISNLHLHIFTGKFVRFPSFSNIHVENLKSPPGYFEISTWKSLFPYIAPFRYVVGAKLL